MNAANLYYQRCNKSSGRLYKAPGNLLSIILGYFIAFGAVTTNVGAADKLGVKCAMRFWKVVYSMGGVINKGYQFPPREEAL